MTLSDQDKDVVRRAAFGAIALVSKADPGFFSTFKESMAGSQALAAAPEPVKELLKGGLIAPPKGKPEEVEAALISDLQQSMQILASDPPTQTGFRDVILSACEQVAQASKGTSDSERAMIEKIRAALG